MNWNNFNTVIEEKLCSLGINPDDPAIEIDYIDIGSSDYLDIEVVSSDDGDEHHLRIT